MPTSSSSQRIHYAVLISWSLLFLWVAIHVLLQSLQPTQWVKLLVYTLPLLLCIRGLWRGERRTHKWATLAVLPYFIVGITEGVANVAVRSWALTMLGLSLLWFFALVAYLRSPDSRGEPHQQSEVIS